MILYAQAVAAERAAKIARDMADHEAGIEALRKQRDDLLSALERLLRVAPADVECENMHHKPKHRHGGLETCPVVVEYAEAISDAVAVHASVKWEKHGN